MYIFAVIYHLCYLKVVKCCNFPETLVTFSITKFMAALIYLLAVFDVTEMANKNVL
jgi:hypothetical protein